MNGTATTDFVVQAPEVPPPVLAALASQAQARAIVPFGAGAPAAYRFPEIAERPELIDAARGASCDAGFVPEDRRLDRVRVVAMDMDSTLITIECVDEIADMKGIKAEVAAITASAMRGEIDFAESLRRRVALLAGLPVTVLDQVYADRLRISPGATRMLAGFKAVGATTVLAGATTAGCIDADTGTDRSRRLQRRPVHQAAYRPVPRISEQAGVLQVGDRRRVAVRHNPIQVGHPRLHRGDAGVRHRRRLR